MRGDLKRNHPFLLPCLAFIRITLKRYACSASCFDAAYKRAARGRHTARADEAAGA